MRAIDQLIVFTRVRKAMVAVRNRLIGRPRACRRASRATHQSIGRLAAGDLPSGRQAELRCLRSRSFSRVDA